MNKKISGLPNVLLPDDAATYLADVTGHKMTAKMLVRHALDGSVPISAILRGAAKARLGSVQYGEDDVCIDAFLALQGETDEQKRAWLIDFLATHHAKRAENSYEPAIPKESWIFSSLRSKAEELVFIEGTHGSFVRSRFATPSENDEAAGCGIMLDTNVVEITGVVDLMLIGDERDDIEQLYSGMQSDGRRQFTAGVYVQTASGEPCQIQEPFDMVEFEARLQRQAQDLECFVIENRLDQAQAEEHRRSLKRQHESHREMVSLDPLRSLYMPASCLPAGSVLVFRREVLDVFASRLARDESAAIVATSTWEPAEDTDLNQPWWKVDPRDPPAGKDFQPWFTPARYLAREFVKADPSLLRKKELLAKKVADALFDRRITRRGGTTRLGANTVLKAFAKVDLRPSR
jgi:hypothetical protein